MDFDLDALPELDADGKPVGQEVDLDALPELDADGKPVGQEVDLDALPELDADGKPVGQEVDLNSLPELDADGKPVEPEKMEQGSPTWAAIKGGIGGFFSGLWAGGNAVANRITKALPEVGIGLESAAGHAARFAGKGLKAIGAEKVGAAVESAGEWIVGDAAGAKAWLDAKLPSDAKDWLGYEDWSTKASDWVGNAAAMAVKFAPGGAKVGGEAFMESVFASDGANAFANVHDTAIEKGASEAEASALGAEAALINYFGGKALMRSGGWAAGVKGSGKQFLASGAASSATMAAQGVGNKMVENLAERKPLMEGVAAEAGEGLVEGAMFHVYNAIPGIALGVKASREARRKNEEYIRGVILEHAKTDQGKAQLATYFDGPSLDAAIQERKAGKSVSRRIADEIGLPETMTAEEINSVVDAVSSQRQAWAARVRVGMDDVQAAALAEEVQGVVGEDARLFERTWLKAVEKIDDAKELDDPAAREKLVMESAEEARRESDAERREARQQSAYVKTVGGVGAQLRMMEGMKIGSVEDAIEKGLVSRDEGGRLTGGARQAVNIATHGTDALKSAVKDGSIDAATAESLITAAHTELGAEATEARAAFIDGILERAKGDAALARRMVEIVGEGEGITQRRGEAESAEFLDSLAERAKASIELEEAIPDKLKDIVGCRLMSIEGGVLGCSRFRGMTAEFGESTDENGNVRKELSVKGLGEGQLAKPGNWADGAVLVAELARIAEKNGAELVFDRAETAIEANGLLAKVKSEGLTRAKTTLETRAKLFDVLARTALDKGVTFDESSFRKALEETPNGRRLVDNHRNIYGITSPDGTLHFNPLGLDYNIPIHEYGHLALMSMKGVNRRLWERGMELVRGSDYYREIKEYAETEGHEYSYLKGNEEGICDEALATMIGDRGERIVEDQGVGAELKAWLKDFWKAFKGAFGLADMTDAQIEKMTLGEFVDAVNAELLRGKEFGTRKQVPLKEKSIRNYDEADGSGSNGVLRWKNDRGRLFNIPVDMERTQPGGRVVLSTDDANITDWIKNRLNGVELRMSKKGKIYVEGRDGFDGELAEIFGRYPKAGLNDGIGEELASVLHNDSLREATPDQLVEMLAKDRANYDKWVKATRDGKTSLEDAQIEQHYADEAAREEAEARQRWEDSGMDVPEYILSRIEDGDPGIDLDWETMREIAHEEAEGKFAVGKRTVGYTAPDGSAKPGYLKAPNGNDSRLDERQWNEVRTESYGKWFGDWQSKIRRDKLDAIKPMKVRVGAISARDGLSAAAAAKRWFAKNVGSAEYNTEVGKVVIDGRSIHDSLAHKYSQAKLDAVTTLKDGFAAAVYIGSGKDIDGKPLMNHYFAYPIQYGSERRIVFCRAREDAQKNRLYLHEVFVEKNLSDSLQTAALPEGRTLRGGIALMKSILNRIYTVKGEDVSKAVDENGEPMVVYRGSEYDPLAQEPGKGVIKPEAYFTADPEYAKRYTGNGGKVQAYYLNIRRPFDIRRPECLADLKKVYPDHEFQKGKSGALDWAEASTIDGEFLKENFGDKYDGIIYDEGGDPGESGVSYRGISYVPLDGGAQVKSATDNIGTFDSGNPDIRFAAGGGTVDSGWIVHGNRLVRRGTPQAAMIGGARVADDAGRGEQTPGTLAASRELSEQPRSRIQELGRVRVTSFPISEIFRMHKELSGNPMPVHVSKRVRGGKVSASSKDGQIYIASDVIGLVDRTDIPPLKEKLGKHGFFRNENEAWAKNHSEFEVRQERERSEAQLGDELRKLADRRASGKELGGQSAERLVYMNEFAKYVMNMPRRRGSLVGDVQTVGDAVRGALNAQLAASGDKRAAQEKKMRNEAKTLLTWSGWRVEDATEADVKDLTDTMFGAWLAIPDEMERLAPTWYDAILETVTTTPSAAKAYRAAADRVYNSPQAYKHVLAEIQRSQSAAVQAMRDKLDAAAKAPITARSLTRRFAEGLVLGYHDQMGLTWMRFDEETNRKLRARKAALAELKRKGATKAELKAAAEEIDLFTGRIHQTKQKLELSRTAMERGIQNESVRYVILNRLLADKAAKKWGLTVADWKLYLDQMWVIDSQGRSGERGESARQARLILGDMARRLGAEKWARMEEFGREWFSIRERELLNDPRLERLVGKRVVDYWRSNAHYVTTKRVQSPEEMEAIERIREKMRKDGINGGDDVCGEMYTYLGSGHGGREMLGEKLWKSRLVGSFADKADSVVATTEKDMKIQQAARVNQYVIDLRDALLMAEVPGVRDMPYGEADVKQGSRYGFITYFDYGEKRTLIVPREIADGFRRDPDTFQWTAMMHRVARGMMIDYNLGYLPRNQMRNAGSIEKNFPGVYESWAKALARFTGLPGAAPLVDNFMEHAARKSAKVDRVLDKVFFGITRFGHINPAERAAKFIFDPEGWQKKFWDAEARGDEDVMRGLLEDKDFALQSLRANMFTTLGNAYGDAVRDERLLGIGKKIGEAIDRTPVARQVKKAADWLPKQNEFEDVFAKLVAFHHDRATFGKAHNRTVEESGLVVKQNVSIPEGERRGRSTNGIHAFFNQFFNPREKGVVRHVKALVERPKETLVKDGMVWCERCVGTMFATGAIAAFIRWLYGDDDKKAEESPLGGTYRFAKFMQAASQNINDYARMRHELVPVWLSPDGYTTITLGAALNDEDSLIAPSADFVARAISARMGLNPPPELGQTVLDTVWRGVAPDLDAATPLVKTLRDTVLALQDNPIDNFTGKPVYDPVLYAVRNESWATRLDFATAMAKRVWDDWGGRAIWTFDRYGKESSDYGSASPWLGLALNKIPVLSSAARRFVKIHVREPGSGSGVDAAVSAEDSRRANVRTYLSDKLLEKSKKMGGELNRLDPGQYKELLEGWQETYRLSAHDMRLLEKRFLNKWSEWENREWVRNKKRNQLLKKATRIGIEESERRMIRGEL